MCAGKMNVSIAILITFRIDKTLKSSVTPIMQH